MFITILTLLIACDNKDGGPCTYNDYVGTCTREEDSSITFTGEIEGETVTFTGNDGWNIEEGASAECTISYITEGTCTPCLLDLGDCGSEAFSYIGNTQAED